MHVLMLGWEFPPFITGGLGTACFGLTRAMDRRGMTVTFVVPKAVGSDSAKHVRLLSPDDANPSVVTFTPEGAPIQGSVPSGKAGPDAQSHSAERQIRFEHVQFVHVPAGFTNPYPSPEQSTVSQSKSIEYRKDNPHEGGLSSEDHTAESFEQIDDAMAGHGSVDTAEQEFSSGNDYGGDIIRQVQRYAQFVLIATRKLNFDIIHAHDWMTYPAGMLLARSRGAPLVTHIHSTEFDRSGEQVNQQIYDIERRGMNSAMRVIAVSQLTKNMVVSRYAVPSDRVEVVYNGVDLEPSSVGMTGIRPKDKIVLYFGRITHQKGPEYFVRAAKRVLEVMENVKFVVAGSGDMAKRMIELAAEMGIGHKVLFTGFLRGADIKRVFNLADLYVMPSVSEPFGIAPLEAMSHNVPALISKSSGVSEVLTHVLKVDFWDIDDMANKIVAVLRYPPLSKTLQEHGAFEVRRLTWDGAAQRCEQIYDSVIREMVAHPTH